jgi:hypothetical protein
MNHPLYQLLRDLESAKLHFLLSRHRDDSVLISITGIGERIEVDVFEDGHMEVSRFYGDEGIEGDASFVARFIQEYKNEK